MTEDMIAVRITVDFMSASWLSLGPTCKTLGGVEQRGFQHLSS